MLTALVRATLRGDPQPIAPPDGGCAWWDFACKGGHEIANAGLSAITRSIAAGAETLLGQIVKTIDQSSTVPLADPTYRHVYYGFLSLAAPLVGVVLCIALVMACVRRDAGTLVRASVGVGVATLGGAFYIVLAQLLVALDGWLSRGVVRVTGYNLADSIDRMARGFRLVAGNHGEVAANMLLILLMSIMLVAGLLLWFVFVLRKVAILVVVAFAPLLIVGYLWAPTRSWVRRCTEVLIALVFTKTAIFTLFGIGLALLSRGTAQSLSDFVGAVVLMCGACFAPMLMLRLVHFAADSHLAGEAMGTLRGGVRPVTSRIQKAGSHSAMGRHDMARSQGQAASPSPEPARAGSIDTGDSPMSGIGSRSGRAGGASGSSLAVPTAGSGAGEASGTATAAGGAATAGVGVVGQAAAQTTKQAAGTTADAANSFADSTQPRPDRGSGRTDPADSADSPMPGPTLPADDKPGDER